MATTNLNLSLPEYGEVPATAGQKLLDNYETIDTHDHSSGKGVRVTTAGININADLEINSHNLTEVNSLELDSLSSALSGASNSNRVNVANGELYFTDGNGLAVQVTANGGLDTTVSGGWTGDYSSTDAEGTYVSATTTFKLLQDGNANQAGKLDIGDIKLRTTVAGASNYISIVSPTLSANWTMTLPAAAPASTSVMTMTDAGTVVNSKELSLTTLSVQGGMSTLGAATASGTLDVTGNATFAATVSGTSVLTNTLAVSGASTFTGEASFASDVVLGSGAEIQHGTTTISIPAVAGTWQAFNSGHFLNGIAESMANTDILFIPIVLKPGDQILSVQYILKNLSANTKTASIKSINFSTGITTTLETSDFTTSGDTTRTLIMDPDITVAAEEIYFFQFNAGGDDERVVGIRVTYDHP